MSRLLLWGVLCAGLGTAVFAAKECAEGTIEAPGINAEGNCDFGLGGDLNVKACLTDKGKWKAIGKGTVENESGETVKLSNSPEVLDCFEADFIFDETETVSRALYKVSKSGKAKLSVKGTVPL